MAELAPDFVNGWQNMWMQNWAAVPPCNVVSLPNSPAQASALWRYVCDRFSNMCKTNGKWLYGADVFKELLNLAKPGAVVTWDTIFSWMRKHREGQPQAQYPLQLNTNTTQSIISKETQTLRDTLNKLSNECPDGADVYSDWLVANVVQDFNNANSKHCFAYIDRAEAPGVHPSKAMYVDSYQRVPLGMSRKPWTTYYYALDMGMEEHPLRLKVTTDPLPGSADLRPNVQVVITDGTRVVDIMRSKGDMDVIIDTTYTPSSLFKRPTLPIRDVFLIFAAEAAGVKYSISLKPL